MANGITGGLENILGIDTTAGNDELKKALAAIQGVNTPTAEQLTLPQLQQYVQQGLLTPAQYNAILADPETYSRKVSEVSDNSGSTAQKSSLSALNSIINAGGSTDINKANLLNNVNQTNQAMKASRDAITENAQERGVSGGGQEFLAKLLGEQGDASNANSNAVNSAANNAQLALNAITQQGTIGGEMQGQANQMTQAQADAARQIAEYNSQLQSTANQYNTQTANAAQAANLAEKQRMADQNTSGANDRLKYNATVPQTIYQDQMQKAGQMAGVYGNQANLAQQHAQQDASFTGGLIGAGATLGGGYLASGAAGSKVAGAAAPAGMDVSSPAYNRNAAANNPYLSGYSQGGMVDCYADGGAIPGDDPANDTVPAMLSPKEIVLPRSVSMAPDAPQKAAQFVGDVKGCTPTVNSFAEALKMLEDQGIEITLKARG